MPTSPATPTPKNTVCLWYDGQALEAARFYVATFPDSHMGEVFLAPTDYPAGRAGEVLSVTFTVAGIPCLALNGGPGNPHSYAFSFQIATDDQAETDRLWDALLAHGGVPSACGWIADRWGLQWQITPRVLIEALADADPAAVQRAFTAMMDMVKIDVAAIERAWKG